MNDPIVDEVRRVRDAQAARFNYDLDAIFWTSRNAKKRVASISFLALRVSPYRMLKGKQKEKRKKTPSNKLTSIALFDRQFSPPDGKSWYLVGIIASLASVV